MTDQVRCDLFHSLDGQCCPKGEPCCYDEQPSRRKPLPAAEVARINTGMQRDILIVVLGLALASVMGAWALTTLENQQKHYDLVNQESAR